MSARLVIMGPQGSGKGTQAARLAQRLGIPVQLLTLPEQVHIPRSLRAMDETALAIPTGLCMGGTR